MYVITVTFTIKSAHLGEFMPAMLENAKASMEQEEGCHHFDVCSDPENPNIIFLYELYTDKSAFNSHLASTHFNDFNDKTTNWIVAKEVRAFQRL